MTPSKIERAEGGWQPIETAPKPHDWLRAKIGPCLIGCWNPQLDPDTGEPYGNGEWVWVHVAKLTHDGWRVWSQGFAGLHGMGTFPLHNSATHWMPLSDLGELA